MKQPSSTPGRQLQKSRIFWVFVGFSALLLAMSLLMYRQLETISRDDDVMPGSGGGDGQALDMLNIRAKKHKHKRHGGLLAGLGEGNRMEGQIEDFRAYKKNEAKRRAKAGIFTKREEFERDTPYGSDEELQKKVQELRVPDMKTYDGMPYDIRDCPHEPPANYPFTWNIKVVLEAWNPDNTDMPSQIHQGLCVFDWNTEREKAINYRDKEVPFVLKNVPQVMKASIRWMAPDYLDNLLGDEPIRNEHSHNNHFMYWKTRHPVAGFEPPTDMVDLTYQDWYHHARELDKLSAKDQTDVEHWYFRLNALFDKHGYVYEELPFFDPSLGESMTMIHPNEHRGINCRFGMKGVTAETHFDSSSNFIALMGGQRRYILAHPDQCEHMELFPQEHPSGRHSSIEWAYFDFDKDKTDRPFKKAQVNEVVMQAGDMLYLPTYWFHFIVSLNLNYQCNSRSGDSRDYEDFIADCGFAPATKTKRHK